MYNDINLITKETFDFWNNLFKTGNFSYNSNNIDLNNLEINSIKEFIQNENLLKNISLLFTKLETTLCNLKYFKIGCSNLYLRIENDIILENIFGREALLILSYIDNRLLEDHIKLVNKNEIIDISNKLKKPQSFTDKEVQNLNFNKEKMKKIKKDEWIEYNKKIKIYKNLLNSNSDIDNYFEIDDILFKEIGTYYNLSKRQIDYATKKLKEANILQTSKISKGKGKGIYTKIKYRKYYINLLSIVLNHLKILEAPYELNQNKSLSYPSKKFYENTLTLLGLYGNTKNTVATKKEYKDFLSREKSIIHALFKRIDIIDFISKTSITINYEISKLNQELQKSIELEKSIKLKNLLKNYNIELEKSLKPFEFNFSNDFLSCEFKNNKTYKKLFIRSVINTNKLNYFIKINNTSKAETIHYLRKNNKKFEDFIDKFELITIKELIQKLNSYKNYKINIENQIIDISFNELLYLINPNINNLITYQKNSLLIFYSIENDINKIIKNFVELMISYNCEWNGYFFDIKETLRKDNIFKQKLNELKPFLLYPLSPIDYKTLKNYIKNYNKIFEVSSINKSNQNIFNSIKNYYIKNVILVLRILESNKSMFYSVNKEYKNLQSISSIKKDFQNNYKKYLAEGLFQDEIKNIYLQKIQDLIDFLIDRYLIKPFINSSEIRLINKENTNFLRKFILDNSAEYNKILQNYIKKHFTIEF